jgi:hypothetical protein
MYLSAMLTRLDEIVKDYDCFKTCRLREEYYLPHVILKISRNNDAHYHVLGATF